MTNPTADDFAARLKYVAAQDFGGTYRPGLVAAIANGSASQDDMNLITGFIKALDAAKVATANQAAGINAETSPQNSDLLMSIGADKAVVQRANSAVTAAKDPVAAGSFLNKTFQTIAQYSANSGDVVFPQPNSFAPGNVAPDGTSNESIWQKGWHGILAGLSWLGRIPGFIYQGAELSSEWAMAHDPMPSAFSDGPLKFGVDEGDKAKFAAHMLGLKQAREASGYGNDPVSSIAHLWSHGESDFNDLGPAISAHGKPLVDTAVKMFTADKGYGSAPITMSGNVDYEQALANYQGKLNVDLRDGKITPKDYAAEVKKLSSPDLQTAYRAVDNAHVSFGRDLARTVVNPETHVGAFKYISGVGDLAFSLAVDPILGAGKAYTGIKAMKYGVEVMGDSSRIYRMYGLADKVTGEMPKLNRVLDAGAFRAQAKLDDWLARNAEINAARAEGDHIGAAALHAQNMAKHPTLKAAYMEAQGWRAASTPEELAKAYADGTTLSVGGDAIAEAINPARGGHTPEEIAASVEAHKAGSIPAVLKAKPLETRQEFADWLVEQQGLYRWLAGRPIRATRMLPGLMGPVASARASMLGRFAYDRLILGAEKNPVFHALATDGMSHLAILDVEKDAGKIIASDEGEAFKAAFAAREAGVGADGRPWESMLNFARGLKGKADATVRRVTTWVPTNRFLALNGLQAGADIERFVRTYGSRDQASFARYLWDHADSESARRQIGRAIVNQVVDTAGITRSPAGRAWMDKWNAAFDDLDHARYGLGDSDLVTDATRGQRRVAMNLSQLETHLVLPSFGDMRRAAAKSAIVGFDQPLDQMVGRTPSKLKRLIAGDTPMKSWVTTADGERDVVAGMRRMLASPTMSIRYGLFNNHVLTDLFGLMKIGWLTTTANALRQFSEEYVGLRLGRHGSDLAEGKRLARAGGHTTALIAKAHHVIPHFMRPRITSEGDVFSAVARGRLAFTWGERELDEIDEKIVANLARHSAQREVLELLGGRQTTRTEGGFEDAIEAHNAGVQMQPVGWKKVDFEGYTEKDLEGDAGRKALAAGYTNLFLDRDEPARRVLAYLMWNEVAKNPKFLAKLNDKTLKLMHDLVPVDNVTLGVAYHGVKKTVGGPTFGTARRLAGSDKPPLGWGGLTPDEFKATGEELHHGTAARFDTFDGEKRSGTSSRGAGDRIYMTTDPEIASKFARAAGRTSDVAVTSETWLDGVISGSTTRGLSDETVANLKRVQRNLSKARADENLPRTKKWGRTWAEAEADAQREWLIKHVIDEGHTVTVGTSRTIRDAAGVRALSADDLWSVGKLDKKYDPRVVKAKVYGKTLDLRTRRHVDADGKPISKLFEPGVARSGLANRQTFDVLHPEIPATLDKALKDAHGWHPLNLNKGHGSEYGHETSKALTAWMRANGYGKALVDDSVESGHHSVIALPEMIAHGPNDPLAAFASSVKTPKPAGKITPPLTDGIKDYIRNAPEMGRFRQLAEWLKHDVTTGQPIPVGDTVAQDKAIEAYLHSQVWNVGNHVFSRGDHSMHAGLVSDLLRGKTPSELELAKIPLKNLPEHVIQAEYAPAATTTADKLGEKIAQAAAMGGKAFDFIVTHPMQRLERKPLFYGNYARAYREIQPYADFLREKVGVSAEQAEGITDRLALGRALQDTVKYLDNPKIASQFSSIAGNFWLFYRAQEDSVRRWMGIVKERPETLRLAHMAVLGGTHSGMLYRDSDGNLTLAYPGSGAIIDAFLMAQRGLGIADEHGLKVPSAHDLTTQLNYLNPSLMNPYGFSATPMVTIPWNLLSVAIPGNDMLKSSVDMAFNGQLGNGRSWWEQFMPTAINRILQLQGDSSDTGSQVGGAAATSILHASIAGQLNDGADDVQRQHKIADLKTMTLTALWARALFSFAAPGATSMPELDYKDEHGNFIGNPDSDLSWRAMGVSNMKDEYRAMIQAFGFDKALAVWMELHPNLLPYTVGKTSVGASSANADPTRPATEWIMDNKALFDGPYARVAAYFIPPAPGAFDQIGWNAMQEIGIRQHKSLEQYYLDVASKNAVSAWYAAKDKYEPMIAQQKASGQRVNELQDEYDKVKAQIRTEYPILTPYFDAHGSKQVERTQTVSSLRAMVADPSVKLPDLKGVAQMLIVLDNYNAKMAELKGQRSSWAQANRQDTNAAYESTMSGIIKKFPGLNDLYNGVFREMEQ